MERSLLQLSEIWPCQIWLTGRMKFALLEVGWGSGPLSLLLSRRSPNMTEILLNGTLLSLTQSIYLSVSMRRFF